VYVSLDDLGDASSTCGRRAGAHLLRAAGARMLSAAGATAAAAARAGGDELAVLYTGLTDPAQAGAAAARLTRAARRPAGTGEGAHPAVATAGVATAAAPGQTAEALLAKARQAMQAAKQRDGLAPAVAAHPPSPAAGTPRRPAPVSPAAADPPMLTPGPAG
jgi:GGDEF domain-containing protein